MSQNIIAPVTEPTEWCAPIVVTPKKKSDRICMCVDLSSLKKYVLHECYQSQTPVQATADIAVTDAQVFTVLDALKGYHHLSQANFLQCLSCILGISNTSSISEQYNRRMANAFTGLQGFQRIFDDIVINDSNITEHITHVYRDLQIRTLPSVQIHLTQGYICWPLAVSSGVSN